MSPWLVQTGALFRRDLIVDLRHRLVYVFLVAEATLMLISYAFLSRIFGGARPDSYEPLPFLLAGIALTDSLTTFLVYLSEGVRSNQQAGTLKVLLAMPISPVRLMSLSMAYPAARAAVDFVLFVGVAILLGLPMAGINIGPTVIVVVLSVLALAGPAVISAAFAVAFKRGDPVRWALSSATWLLSGVLYPTAVLPSFLQGVAACLPTTYALKAVRATMIDGAGLSQVSSEVAVLAGFAIIGIPASLWLFGQGVDYARRGGTIGHT